MKLVYSFLLLLLATSTGHAQPSAPDFLVKANGDTIRGKFRKISEQGKPSFVLYQGANALSFTTAEVSSYGEADGLVFVKKQIGRKGPQAFVRPLVLGYVSLYANASNEPARFYLQPTDSAYAIEVLPELAQLTFHRLLGGCAGMHFNTDESRSRYPYTHQGMRRLVQAYNHCLKPTQPMQLVSASAGWHKTWGIKAGVHRSSYIEYEEEKDSRATPESLGYQLGGTLNIRNRSKFSLQLEATFLLLRGMSTPTPLYTSTNLYSLTRKVDIRFIQLQVPVLVRYKFGKGPIQPYVNAGPSLGFNMANSTKLIYQYQYANRVETDVFLQKYPEAISIGYAGGAGVLFNRSSGPGFSLEARFDQMDDRMRNLEYRPRHRSLRLDLGIHF
jgi:hypothetical protein